MRCYICDKALTDVEIQMSPDGHSYEPCGICMEIALDAAYSDGVVIEESLDDPDLNNQFGSGAVETLDPTSFVSSFDEASGFRPDRYSE